MIKQTKLFKYAFAQDGDKATIPDDSQGDKLSFQSGYTKIYSTNPEEGGEYIKRPEFNGLINQITQAILDSQRNGGFLYDSSIAYNAGARVMVFYDILKNKVIETPNNAISTATIILVSQKDNNTDSPYELPNLFKSWWVDDGNQLGFVKMCLINNLSNDIGSVPVGYIDVGATDINTKQFQLTDYPRIAKAFEILNSNNYGFFTKKDSYFTISDLRGAFPRIYANGIERDSGREFNTLQDDAIRNITGEIALMDDDAYNQHSTTYNSMYNISAWYPTDSAGAFGIKRQSTEDATMSYNSNPEYTTGINAGGAGQSVKQYLGNIATFDASKIVPTAKENRPYNFNVKFYIKC